MNKIVITVPYKSKKWKISAFGGRGKHKPNASSVVAYIKNQFLLKDNLNSEGNLKEKTCVKVKYDQDVTNESLSSVQPRYLIYCLVCFLEDYLPENILKYYEKQRSEEYQ